MNGPSDHSKWIEAATRLTENPSSQVPCPKCGLAFLTVQDEQVDSEHIDGHLRCLSCGAHESVFKRVERISEQRLVTETRRRIELNDYEAVFAHGGCFHFALRLHEQFNLKLRGIRDGYLIHVWGLKPDGNGVDIRGVYPEKLLARLSYGGKEAPICDVPDTEVRERVKAKGYPPELEKEIFELADWLIDNHERFAAAKPVDEKLIAEGLADLQRSSNGAE